MACLECFENSKTAEDLDVNFLSVSYLAATGSELEVNSYPSSLPICFEIKVT